MSMNLPLWRIPTKFVKIASTADDIDARDFGDGEVLKSEVVDLLIPGNKVSEKNANQKLREVFGNKSVRTLMNALLNDDVKKFNKIMAKGGLSPEYALLMGSTYSGKNIVDAILTTPVEKAVCDVDGWTPLMSAVREGQTEVVLSLNQS